MLAGGMGSGLHFGFGYRQAFGHRALGDSLDYLDEEGIEIFGTLVCECA